ncbi:PQQ-dependent sugar dehydrogenase [soil metagenome]
MAVSPAAALPPNFRDTVAVSGLTEPTQVRFAPNGKVYVAEKSGIVKELDSLDDTTPRVVADLRTNVHNYWDRGLLGLAVDPGGARLYVSYAYDHRLGDPAPPPRWGTAGQDSDGCPDPSGTGCEVSARLSRIDVATGAETPLVEDWCEQYPSQSVGEVSVGPDGNLYMPAGDGASFFHDPIPNTNGPRDTRPNPCGDPPNEGGKLRGQDWRTPADPLGLGGSAIRVDPDTGYGVPGNPGYTGNGNNNQSRIIGYGFRNPYRAALRPGTSDLYIGDVGQGSEEMVKRISSPTLPQPPNLGWGCYEGTTSLQYEMYDIPLCQSLYANPSQVTFPLYKYRHDTSVVAGDGCPLDGGAAISGLAFAPGTGEYPASYRGALFFADYARRCIWYMEPGSGGVPDPARLRFFGATVASGDYAGPVDLEFGPSGDLFYVDLVPGTSTGTVRRIGYLGPIAQAAVDKTDPGLGETVRFSSAGSRGDTPTFAWDLDGDGQFDDSNLASPTRSYSTAVNVTVRLKVTDALGSAVSAPLVVRPGNTPPVATIDAPAASLKWTPGQNVAFSGRASDADEPGLGRSSISWSVLLLHCPAACHVHTVQSFAGVESGSFTLPDHELPYYLELTLTVTDARGATDVKTVKLDPAVRLRVQSDPPGVPLSLDGASSPDPLESTRKTGTPRAISAPDAYGDLRFDGWSDGGAPSHSVTPTEDTTLVARYRGPPPQTPLPPPQTPLPPPVLPGLPHTLDRTPPRLSVAAKRRQPALRTRFVSVAVRCPDEACTARASGALKVGARTAGAKSKGAARRALAGQRVTLAVRLSAKALRAARRAAGSRRRVTLTLSIVAKDAAGNRTTARRTVELVR